MLVRTLVLGTSIRKIHVHVGINRHTRARTYAHILVSRPTFSHPYSQARTLAHTRTYYSRQYIFRSVHVGINRHTRARTYAHILVSRPTFSHPYSQARTLAHTRTYYSRQYIF